MNGPLQQNHSPSPLFRFLLRLDRPFGGLVRGGFTVLSSESVADISVLDADSDPAGFVDDFAGLSPHHNSAGFVFETQTKRRTGCFFRRRRFFRFFVFCGGFDDPARSSAPNARFLGCATFAGVVCGNTINGCVHHFQRYTPLTCASPG